MRTLLDYLIYVCAFCIIGAGAVGAWDAVTVPGQVATSTTGETAGAFDISPTPFPGRSLVTVLIVGADDRDGEAGRSDSMIVLFLNPRTNQVALLSVPRDLLVTIPGHGRSKINASYAFGGVDLARETIEEVFDGVNIDFYAKADFKGFISIVDMLGGVDIEVPDVEGRGRGMNYDDDWGNLHIHLKPGYQHLDGEQAIGFVRYRKSMYDGLGDGDFARSERQQEFLKALVEQKLKLTNVLNLAKVAGAMMKLVETDLSLREGGELALALRNVKPAGLLQASLQPYLRDDRYGEQSVVRCGEPSIRRVLGEIDAHLRSQPGMNAKIVVLNGGGEAGAAADASLRLSRQGFEPEDTGNADSFDYEQTLIRYPHDQQAAARAIKRALGAGSLEEIDEDDLTGDDEGRITVIIGADFDFQTDDSVD